MIKLLFVYILSISFLINSQTLGQAIKQCNQFIYKDGTYQRNILKNQALIYCGKKFKRPSFFKANFMAHQDCHKYPEEVGFYQRDWNTAWESIKYVNIYKQYALSYNFAQHIDTIDCSSYITFRCYWFFQCYKNDVDHYSIQLQLHTQCRIPGKSQLKTCIFKGTTSQKQLPGHIMTFGLQFVPPGSKDKTYQKGLPIKQCIQGIKEIDSIPNSWYEQDL